MSFSLLLRRCLALFCFCLAASAGALVLTPADGLDRPLSLANAVEVMSDPPGAWRVEEMRDGAPTVSTPEAGCAPDATWLRFSAARTAEAPARWLLRLRPVRLCDVTLYAPDGHGGYGATRLGGQQPSEPPEIVDRHFVFPLTLGTEGADYFVRVQNDARALTPRLELWQPAGFERQHSTDDALVGALLGAVALTICMNLGFLVRSRNGFYAHYALYLLVLCALLVLQMGYVTQWFRSARTLPLEQTMLALQCVFNAVTLLFMARLFGFRRHSRWAARFFSLMVAFNLAMLAPVLAGHQMAAEPWIAIGGLASGLCAALFIGYLVVSRRHFQYLLPAAAFSVGAALGLGGLLRAWLGEALPDGLDEHLQLFGTMAHLVLLSLAVTSRTQQAERKYRIEKERLWAATRDAEHALEVKVLQRTAELAHANVALRDEIYKRGQLEARLLQSIEIKRNAIKQQHEFVSMVSHEFRTPLAVIDAAAQSLDISELGTEPTVKLRTAKIRRSVQRLSMLIENILTADRLQLEQRPLRLERVDVELLLRALCDTFNLPGARRLRLEARASAPEVEADRSLLEIALQNLMHNALKYSPSECGVRVLLNTTPDGVSIEVIDQGSGVAADEVDHIFQPYYRSATMAKVPGSGLGLHLSREIARRHGGDVSLVATGEEGSTFRLVLPTSPPPPPPRSDFAALEGA